MRILTRLVFILLTAHLALWGATPVPATLLPAGPDEVDLSWNVIPGRTYLLQSTTNLSAPWQDPLPAPSTITSATNSISQRFPADSFVRFFRVQLLDTSGEPSPRGMAVIPPGLFAMGDTFNEGTPDEQPVHSVFLSSFYIDKTEVTKTLWDQVTIWNGGNGYTFDHPGDGKAGNHPVQRVSWYDVVKWCNARSQKEGRVAAYYTDAALTQVYKTGKVSPYVKWGAGYRLPTEAEWEKAARGRASGHRFPWSDGDTITHSRANYNSSSDYSYDISPRRGTDDTYRVEGIPYTSPVGSFAANGYVLYDMAGNVWEWCWDWYGAYSNGSQTDPRGPSSGSHRVVRGGSWDNFAYLCRSADRTEFFGPDFTASEFGFRSVLSPGQP